MHLYIIIRYPYGYAYVIPMDNPLQGVLAYVSERQHTSAYVSIRQHTSAYVSQRVHTAAYVSVYIQDQKDREIERLGGISISEKYK